MKRVLLAFLVSGFCWNTPLALAASDYLLELDGIKGESKDSAHPNTIEISSFSWGVSNSSSVGTGSGAGSGKVSFQDFHFTMKASKATPQLLLACATGQHIKSAKLFVRKAGGDGSPAEYYVITLTDLLVSSLKQSGSTQGGDSVPTDTLSLSATSLTTTFTGDDGSTVSGSATRSPDEPPPTN